MTTLTIMHDGIHSIPEDPKGFCNKLYSALLNGEPGTFGHGGLGNLVIMQETRHSDNSTIYVMMGGGVCEMDINSEETRKLIRDHPDYAKDMLDHMEEQTRRLREMMTQE